MAVKIVLILSLALQAAAVILSLRLVRVTGWALAWVLLPLAMLLMIVRRAVSAASVFFGPQPAKTDLPTELVALAVSLFLFLGVIAIVPVFRRVQRDRNLLRTLIDGIPDFVYVKDAQARFAMANRALLTAFDMKDECEIIGMTSVDLLGEPTGPEALEDDRRVLAGAQLVDREQTYVGRDGVARRYWSTKTPLRDPDGAIRGLVGISRDVTARKEAEEQRRVFEDNMREAQRLESLGVLAGGIAHDFNNLLTGILGNTSLARRGLAAESPIQDPLENAEKAAQRAADLCRQLLAYSGKGRFVVHALNLSELVREMAEILRVSISKHAKLQLDLARDLPPIEADATQVRQIVMNLITNASEAIGDAEGLIAVSTGVAVCNAEYFECCHVAPSIRPGRFVFVEVRDSGAGMDIATQARIFDPFFTTKFAGRGLGLAAVLGIVRGHNGAIRVYSEPARGTTVKALFPVGRGVADPTPFAPAEQREEWRGSGLVLVVDDEDLICKFASRVLNELGFEVAVARDGQEAVEFVARNAAKIRLVLLDMTLPRLRGDEVFREIRRTRPDLPVILSSGYNEQDATQYFVGRGLSGFLQKPYRAVDLTALVREVLEQPPKENHTRSAAAPPAGDRPPPAEH